MKKVFLLFIISFSILGYSQNPIQTNITDYKVRLNEENFKRLNSNNLDFIENKLRDFNPNQKNNEINSQSFERKLIVNEEVSYRLDSLETISFDTSGVNSKYEYSYDENGNQTLYIQYFWNSESQSLFVNYKVELSYDENGNQTLYINYNWDYESQSLVPQTKQQYSYDENGNRILWIYNNWNPETQSFVPDVKYEYSYDENRNRTISVQYNWNSESQSFVLNSNEEYSYDENRNRLLYLNYNWDSETQSFVPFSKGEYFYDEKGNINLYTQYLWDLENQSFDYNLKVEYSYDDNGNLTLFIQSSWNPESQSFVPNYKVEYSYDENGNRTLYIQYYWDSESQSLVTYYKDELSYDENGNQTLVINYRIQYQYNPETNQETLSLLPQLKQQYSYDEYGNRILSLRYYFDSNNQLFYIIDKIEDSYDENNFGTQKIIYSWNSELEIFRPSFKMDISTFSETDTKLVREGIMFEYDTNFNTWNELEGEEFKSYWYYTKESSLSTNSVELNSFSIYPNPTKGNLKINSSESLINPFFELYDIKGSKIFSKPFNFSEPIDVNGLKPSIYLYKIIDGNEVKQSGKVIKE